MFSIKKLVILGVTLICSFFMLNSTVSGEETKDVTKEVAVPSAVKATPTIYKRIVGPEQITIKFPSTPIELGDKAAEIKAFEGATAADYSKDKENPIRWGYTVFQNMKDPELSDILKEKAGQVGKNNHIDMSSVSEKYGYPATEIVYTTKDGNSTFRKLIVKTPYNIYEIFAHGPKGTNFDSFFDSIEIVQINQ